MNVITIKAENQLEDLTESLEENLVIKTEKSKYKRILLKLSGESLMGDRSFGIDPEVVQDIALQIAEIVHAIVAPTFCKRAQAVM